MAGEFNVTEDIVVSKNNECSSSLVEKNPNYWDFNLSYGNCMVSDLEDADLGSLPGIRSVRSIFFKKNTIPKNC